MAEYRIGVTSELTRPDGTEMFGDLGLDRLTAAGLEWEQMPAVEGDVPPVELVGRYDAVLSIGHLHFPRHLVAAAPRLRHVARFGAGYDGIDLAGLAAEGVVVTNTPTAVRRPLAVAALTLLLAQAHRLPENHRAAAEGRWADRGRYRGLGVAGRTVGILGFGAVGQELAELLRPFGVRVLATNRSGASPRAAELGVTLVPAAQLAAESDYVVVTAALTPSSHHLVDAAFLAEMRPSAHLVNVARGAVVDQAALVAALQSGAIAGAALDVLDPEPPSAEDPLLSMSQVIVTPHALCWTEDFTREVSGSVVQALVDVAQGRRPEHVLNPEAWERRRG